MANHDPDGDLLGLTSRKRILEQALGKRQCMATAKHTGKRCTSSPIIGGFVCKMHGGNSPQVKDAARARLRALVDPAIDALTRAITFAYSDPCPTCGGPQDAKMMAVVVKASQLVLDRAGYAPKHQVEVTTPSVSQGYEKYLTDEQLMQIQQWVAEAKAKAAAAGDIIDVEASDVMEEGEEEPLGEDPALEGGS